MPHLPPPPPRYETLIIHTTRNIYVTYMQCYRVYLVISKALNVHDC